LPKQGSKLPWKLRDNYVLDAMSLRSSPLDDGVMRFSHPRRTALQGDG
jgi:monooxygenase